MTKIYCPELYPQKLKYRNKELDQMFTIYCNENKGIDEDVIDWMERINS
jgi:hypothetical protein